MRPRRFPVSRKLAMALGDVAIIGASYIIATACVLDAGIYLQNIHCYSGLLPLLALVTLLLFRANGLYAVARRRFAEIVLSLLAANATALILVGALAFFLFDAAASRKTLVLAVLIETPAIGILRYAAWRAERAVHAARALLVIGPAEECARVLARLSRRPELGMHLRYVCTDLAQGAWRQAAEEVDVLLLCPGVPLREKGVILGYCHEARKEALLAPGLFEVCLAGARLGTVDDIPVFCLEPLAPSLETRAAKRCLDLALALAGLLVALPFLAAAALAIKLSGPGPVLYSQIRTGRGGRPFRVWKLRTMRPDAEKLTGPVLARENDPRITPLGRFLRATRLDELPQIWNVLEGSMSIVGPRPERPVFVERFARETPAYALRHSVKPGITGLAQILGKYNTAPSDKLVYDLLYIERCSLAMDLSIILRTVRVLFAKSATEGAGGEGAAPDLRKYEVGRNIYGDS